MRGGEEEEEEEEGRRERATLKGTDNEAENPMRQLSTHRQLRSHLIRERDFVCVCVCVCVSLEGEPFRHSYGIWTHATGLLSLRMSVCLQDRTHTRYATPRHRCSPRRHMRQDHCSRKSVVCVNTATALSQFDTHAVGPL